MAFILVLILMSMLAVSLSSECTDVPVSEHVGVSVLEYSELLIVGIIVDVVAAVIRFTPVGILTGSAKTGSEPPCTSA